MPVWTTAGKRILATRLYTNEAQEAQPVTHIAVGEGSAPTTGEEQGLEAELIRKPVRRSPEGRTRYFAATLGSGEANGLTEADTEATVREIGLYAGDRLVTRDVLSEGDWEPKNDRIRLEATWEAHFLT